MLSRSRWTCALAVVLSGCLVPSVQAGPLRWLFGGRSEPAYPVGSPVPLGNGYGAAPGTTAGFAPGYPVPAGAFAAPAGAFPAPAGAFPAPTNGFSAPTTVQQPAAMPPTYATNFGNYYGANMPAIGPAGVGYAQPVPGGVTAATLPAQAMAPQFPVPTQQPLPMPMSQQVAMPQQIPMSQPMAAGQPMPMPQPMSYVPNYDSRALRAPVTYYRPLMTTDPNTGAQVVAMAPCTSYQYLTQRVPTWGQSALYGSYQAPPTAPQLRTVPTYTLPSGGIPLAQGVPSISLAPTTTSYGAYSTLQPALTVPQSSPGTFAAPPSAIPSTPGYATSPTGNAIYYGSPYNGSPSCGSTGSNSSAPIPGLSAPPAAPYSATPNLSSPGYSTPGYSTPGYSSPGYSAPAPTTTFPPPPSTVSPSPALPANPFNPVLPSTDPADTVPSLAPNTSLRPQLRSIVPEAGSTGSESARNGNAHEDRSTATAPSSQLPVMSPLPAPKGLEKPRWNPGLLREEDMTALRPVTRFDSSGQVPPQYPGLARSSSSPTIAAGQSKKIQWASFEIPTDYQHSVPSANASPGLGSTNVISPTQASTTVALPTDSHRPTDSQRPVAPAKRYDNSGWKASR